MVLIRRPESFMSHDGQFIFLCLFFEYISKSTRAHIENIEPNLYCPIEDGTEKFTKKKLKSFWY